MLQNGNAKKTGLQTIEDVRLISESLMLQRRSTTCPACSHPVEITRSIFRLDFRCPHCDSVLEVSRGYTRLIVLLGVLLGYALAWKIGILGPGSCFLGIPWLFFLLWIPLGFLALTFLVRVAPLLVRPTLVLRRGGHVTLLNLTLDPKNDKRI